jgi:hypothetical protein
MLSFLFSTHPSIFVLKDYLGCRMERNLMAKEEWSKLGYGDLEPKNTS